MTPRRLSGSTTNEPEGQGVCPPLSRAPAQGGLFSQARHLHRLAGGSLGSVAGSLWFPVVVAATLVAVAWPIGPLGDDWGTTKPIFTCDTAAFTSGPFFRPFEQTTRCMTGWLLFLYPLLPRLVALAGHLVSALVLARLLQRGRNNRAQTSFMVGAWLFFPGTLAGALSLDGATQTWSTAWGLLATLQFERKSRFWLASAALAAFSKESGVCWFVAAPMMASAIALQPGESATDWARRWRAELTRGVLFGLCGLAAYFAIRTLAVGPIHAGHESERYSLALGPVRILRNIAQLLPAGVVPFDTVAWFADPKAPGLALSTLALSLPLLLVLAFRLAERGLFSTALRGLALLLVAGPHLLMGHVSEMYDHPVSAAALLLLATLLAGEFRFRTMVVGAWLLASVVASGHKVLAMGASAREAERLGREFFRLSPSAPEQVCTIGANQPQSYSVFAEGPGLASGWGAAALPFWGFPGTRFVQVDSPSLCPSGALVLRIDAGSLHILSYGSASQRP